MLAAGSLAAGAFRHLCYIWKHQTISGVNLTFVGLDAAGDLSSMLAISESLYGKVPLGAAHISVLLSD